MVRIHAWRTLRYVHPCNNSNTTQRFLVFSFGITGLDNRNGIVFHIFFSVTGSQESSHIKLWFILCAKQTPKYGNLCNKINQRYSFTTRVICYTNSFNKYLPSVFYRTGPRLCNRSSLLPT